MTGFEFYNLVFENMLLYLLLIGITSFFFIYIGKKYTNTWIDPLRITLVSITFTSVVPLFLFWFNNISIVVFSYFIASQIAFWAAFSIFGRRNIVFSKKKLIHEEKIAFTLFLIFLTIYIVSISLTYIFIGIPIFMESRLDTYTGTGLGVLARIMPFSQIYCIFYSFIYWRNTKGFSKRNLLVIFSFIILLITGVLSGSRSSFFIFLFVYWGFCTFYLNETKHIFKIYKYLFLGVIVSVFSFILKSDTPSIFGGLSSFVLRIVSSGDNYYMAFPNDVWKQVSIISWSNHLFYGILGPLRLINPDTVSPPVGFQLTWLVNPTLNGVSTGPLSSPSLLGLIYFGWVGGLLYSFIMGLFVSFVIYNFPKLLPKGIIFSIIYLYVYMQMLSFIQDSTLGMTYLFDTLLMLIVVSLLLIFVHFFYYNKLKKE